MNIKPQWIDGHFYRYGEREKIFDDAIRLRPERALAYIGDSAKGQDIYFAKKLLVLPPPISTDVLRKISADYSLRASAERDHSRADHYWSRSAKYLRRYLAFHPNDVGMKNLLLEKLAARLVTEAYQKPFLDWAREGSILSEPIGVVDQQVVLDMIVALNELAQSNAIVDYYANCFELAMRLDTRTEVSNIACQIFARTLSNLPRPLTYATYRIISSLTLRERAA